VAVEADSDFQFYQSGIINNPKCGTDLDHAILAVGFSQSGGYYIVRNSWGSEQGYVRIAIADGAGICGVQAGPPSWCTAA